MIADYLPRIRVRYKAQIAEPLPYANIRDIAHPKLVGTCRDKVLRQIRIPLHPQARKRRPRLLTPSLSHQQSVLPQEIKKRIPAYPDTMLLDKAIHHKMELPRAYSLLHLADLFVPTSSPIKTMILLTVPFSAHRLR